MDPFNPPLKIQKEHEHDAKIFFFVYHDYSLADAYLNLVVAVVSANSVFLTPVLTALWKLLALPSLEEGELSTER
jgi:hypothetical protein